MPNQPQGPSTYKTHRFNFVGSPQARDGTTVGKDQRFVNCFPELIKSKITDGKKYYLKERPGLTTTMTTASGTGRGTYYYNNSFFTAIGNSIYRNGSFFLTLANATGAIGFYEYNGTYDALIILDGIAGYVIKTDNSITNITDVNFPTPHSTKAAYLNGRFYISKLNTADIYNSELEDPLTWPVDGFITAEMYPDTLVGLVRNNNYIYAIGTETLEFFYDAAIDTGSPLARQDAAVQQFGSPAPDTIVGTESDAIFVGQTGNGGRTVWKLSGFKPTEIGLESVRQSLDEQDVSISLAKAYCVRTMGHQFYILLLTNRTWVYDFDEEMWHEWSGTANDTDPFPYSYATDHPGGHAHLLHNTNGKLCKLTPTVATDDGVNIYMSATTLKVDFDVMDRKMCSRLTLVCDTPGGAGTSTISWSDDDYATWSTPRTVDTNSTMPSLTQLGQFRRRAFKFMYNQAVPIRIEGFELDFNSGSQ